MDKNYESIGGHKKGTHCDHGWVSSLAFLFALLILFIVFLGASFNYNINHLLGSPNTISETTVNVDTNDYNDNGMLIMSDDDDPYGPYRHPYTIYPTHQFKCSDCEFLPDDSIRPGGACLSAYFGKRNDCILDCVKKGTSKACAQDVCGFMRAAGSRCTTDCVRQTNDATADGASCIKRSMTFRMEGSTNPDYDGEYGYHKYRGSSADGYILSYWKLSNSGDGSKQTDPMVNIYAESDYWHVHNGN